ncbi:MAG: response regulator transcription factor [Burkholderiaceae bacterium]|nr:response regulator transcription factor [Burkholderiaceae bacterium]
MSRKVLLVDDDSELLSLLSAYLELEGFEVKQASDGISGAEMAVALAPDIVVLDVMMPGINGIQTLSRIRARSDVPVIMLTARGDDADRIMGLELGADDYVPKPCTPRELVARIRAILKRANNAASVLMDTVQAGPLTVMPQQRRAEISGEALNLTSTEFNLVWVLARHAGRIVSKELLSTEAMGRPLNRYDRSIDVHMSSIRQKLGQAANGASRIQTVYGRGYQLINE